jgi:hypothetical protein
MIRFILIAVLLLAVSAVYAQILIPDFPANDYENNSNGVWRPRIAAAPDGSFSVAWEDYSDRPGVNSNTTGRSQIAVRRFSDNGQPLEQIHFYRGESTLISMWLFDYMEHAELKYLHSGVLLVLMQHSGRLVIGADDVGSSEITLGAIHSNGQMIKLSSVANNVQYPLIFTSSHRQDNPRLAVTPGNLIIPIFDELSYDSGFRNVAFRALDDELGEVISREIPHSDGVGQSPHVHADIATNGDLVAAVWQDGRYGGLWSIGIQFYTQSGSLGQNRRVNDTSPGTAYALWPSVAMNAAGQSVVVWFDSRNGSQLYGQLFDAGGNPAGANFQITDTPQGGGIYFRPEVAMRNDGSFMVVWTDSTLVQNAFRARGRQFDANGNPMSEPFILPDIDIYSGYPHIASDGSAYYCVWLDGRLSQQFEQVYTKKIGNIITSMEDGASGLPEEFRVLSPYPNPFNPVTTIEYEIPFDGHVTITLHDILGRKIKDILHSFSTTGKHTLTLNGDDLGSGVYFIRLEHGNSVRTKSAVLIK